MMADAGPLAYGQLSVWRDIEGLPVERWHEANVCNSWRLPEGLSIKQVRRALYRLGARHRSLHTVYQFEDPAAPRQILRPFDGQVELLEAEARAADAEDLMLRGFDLRKEFGWRARIHTERGSPLSVAFVRHHMVADGWCDKVLADDLVELLQDSGGQPEAAVPGPLDLALWQRSDQRSRHRDYAVAQWEKVIAAGPSAYPQAGLRKVGFMQSTLRSRRARSGAQAIAAQTGTSMASVLLTAFVNSVARITGLESVTAQLMSSNRIFPEWRNTVTSMNQWVAVPMRLTLGTSFAEQVTLVYQASLPAYRHGMYDVDTVAALLGRRWLYPAPYEATCAFNFFTRNSSSPAISNDPEIVREPPFSKIGHRCYLRAFDESGELLALGLRTKDIPRDQAESMLHNIHELLVGGMAL
jgi:Condensation domain